MKPASAETGRIFTLDFQRGVAVMGILLLNVVSFAMPEMAYLNPAIYGGNDGADLIVWLLNFVLADGKMRGLFSMLFGASMMLIADRAAARDENPDKVHYARMAWLALIGLAHFVFLWSGDILFLYAVMGSVAFQFRHLEPMRLIALALAIYMIGALITIFLMMGPMLSAQLAATAPDASLAARASYAAIMADPEMSGSDVPGALAIYRGDYAAILTHRVTEQWSTPFAVLFKLGPECLPLMLLGMALFRSGFLTGERNVSTYWQTGLCLYALGAVGTAAIGWIIIDSGFDMVVTLNAWMGWALIPRLPMTVGLASLLIALAHGTAASNPAQRIAAAGRMALSNYLGTSLVMTAIFYGWGLGYFGQFGRAELYLFVIAVWALMLLWSKPWLARFHYGPFEWLWRSLARGQMQPLLRKQLLRISSNNGMSSNRGNDL